MANRAAPIVAPAKGTSSTKSRNVVVYKPGGAKEKVPLATNIAPIQPPGPASKQPATTGGRRARKEARPVRSPSTSAPRMPPPQPAAQRSMISDSDTSSVAAEVSSFGDGVKCQLCSTNIRPIFALSHVYKRHINERLLECRHCDFKLSYSTARMRKHVKTCHKGVKVSDAISSIFVIIEPLYGRQ